MIQMPYVDWIGFSAYLSGIWLTQRRDLGVRSFTMDEVYFCIYGRWDEK